MRRSWKTLVALLLAAMMLLGACSGGTTTQGGQTSDEPTEIVVWHNFTDYQLEAFQKIADDFNAGQSEVKVVVQAQPYNDWDQKVMQAVRNGTGPNIILDYPATVANYINDGFVVNLTPYIEDSEIGIADYKNSISEGIYKEATQYTDDGGQYIMPFATTGTLLFYNKTLWNELNLQVPATWDELVQCCETIRESKNIPGFGFDSLVDGAQILLMQSGASYVDLANNVVDINTPATVETYTWFAQQVNNGNFKLQPDDYFSTEFGAQAIGSFIGSAAGYGYVVDAVGDSFEFDMAPIPQGSTKWSPAWNRGAIVFKSDEAGERASYLFLKYFVSEEVNKQWCMDFGALSPYTAVNANAEFQKFLAENPALQALYGGMDTVGYIPAFNGSSTVREEISKALQEVSVGLKDAATALSDAEAACNAELAD